MEQLRDSYNQGNLIIFVGAGVSANLRLPTWSQLIDEVARQLDYDPDVFKTYGDALALAEYYRLTKGSIGSLRSWMDREFHRSDIDITKSDIHRYIVEGNFYSIYTTNYDRWLEKAHEAYNKPYIKIAKVSDLVKAKECVRQIIKFHGDFDDDSSIVLDESSYFERLQFETPLDIKFRSDILGKSVLFIGYSLTDIDIRLLFYRLSKMWREYGMASARPKSYLFNHRPNPVHEEILQQWGIKMISSDSDDPGEALTEFLKDLVK